MILFCIYCKKHTINTHTDYQRIVGWQRKVHTSSRRGGSDIVLRETREQWACRWCIEKLRRGNIGQQELL